METIACRFSLFPLALCVLSAALFAAEGLSPPPEKAARGLERGAWTVEAWGNPGVAQQAAADGRTVLALSYEGGTKDKTAYRRAVSIGAAADGKVRAFVFAANDGAPPVSIVLATGAEAVWHETKPTVLRKGWNALEFSIGANDWKSPASNWRFEIPVAHPEDIRALSIVVYNRDKSGTLQVLGLACDPDESGRKIAALITDMRSDDAGKRERAEKELVLRGRPAIEPLSQLGDGERPEVLMRAAAVIREIEASLQAPAAGNAGDADAQRGKQAVENAKRRVAETLAGLAAERAKLEATLADAKAELERGRGLLLEMRAANPEEAAAYARLLDKLEAALKEPAPKP
jgi:hypothetical protein